MCRMWKKTMQPIAFNKRFVRAHTPQPVPHAKAPRLLKQL